MVALYGGLCKIKAIYYTHVSATSTAPLGNRIVKVRHLVENNKRSLTTDN